MLAALPPLNPALAPASPARQFSSFLQAEPAQAVVETDPGLYWAQASRRRQRKKSGRRRQTDAGSRGAAAGKKEGGLVFLHPEPGQTGQSGGHCRPANSISAFTFLNFVLAAASVAANIISNNSNDNNNGNNNNNNNNDNSLNTNNNNNNNNNNMNMNMITIPVGRRRHRRTINRLYQLSLVSGEAEELLASCSAIINNIFQFCHQTTPFLQGVISKTFTIEMKAKLC